MKHKVFLHAYCHNNLGDDLFIRIICRRYPKIKFFLMVNPGCDEGLRDLNNLHILKRNLFFRVINKFSEVLSGRPLLMDYFITHCGLSIILGGSMFIENDGKWEKNLHFVQKLREQSENLIITGANFGPYHSEEFLQAYRTFFSKSEDACFRDKWSEGLFSNLKQVRCAPDVVMNLDISKYSLKKRKKMTIIPIWLEHRTELAAFSPQYKKAMAVLAEEAVENDWEVVFQSFCKEQGDERAIESILDEMSSNIKSKVKCYFYRGNIDEALQSIANSEVVVTTRFHGMILGWQFGAKVYPIIYSNKMTNFLNDVEYDGNFMNINQMQMLSLKDVINDKNKIDATQLIVNAKDQFTWLDSNFVDEKVNM